MKKTVIFSASLILMLITACNQPKNESDKVTNENPQSDNPLFTESNLPYQAPDWSKIKSSHFAPAFEEGIKQSLAEIEAIANSEEEPTFDNTLVALEKRGPLLSRVSRAFNTLTGANTDEELKALQQEIAPKLASLSDAVLLNTKLFGRVNAIYQNLESLNLDDESKRLVSYYYDEFVKAGANLTEDEKDELRNVNQELASLSAEFSNQLLEASKAGALEVDNREALAGLTDSQIEAAKSEDGNTWRLSLQNTTQQPIMSSLDNRKTREDLFNASVTRAEKAVKMIPAKPLKNLLNFALRKPTFWGMTTMPPGRCKRKWPKIPTACWNSWSN